MLRRALFMLLAGSLLLAPRALAQTAQRFSLQVSALGVQLTGVANEELKFGGGGEIQIRYNPNRFSIGAGGQTTRHTLGAASVTYKGAFLEPRLIIASLGDVAGLYASARLMSLKATIAIGTAEISGDGSALSGGGGILIRLGSRLNGDLGVTVGKEFYNGEAAKGSTVVTRLGLAIGLGS